MSKAIGVKKRRVLYLRKITCPTIMFILVLFFSLISWQQTGVGIADVGLFIAITILYTRRVRIDRLFMILMLLFLSYYYSGMIGIVVYNYDFEIRSLVTFLISIYFTLCLFSYDFSEVEIELIILSYIIISALGSVLILFSVLRDDQYGYFRYTAHVFGIYRDSLYMCCFQMGSIYICINRFFHKKNKVLYFVLFSLIIVGQLFTGDRTAIVVSAFSIVYSVAVYFIKRKKLKKLLLLLLILSSVIFLGYKFVLPLMSEYTVGRLFSFRTYIEDNSRFVMWRRCLEIFSKHVLFGIGYNNNNVILMSEGLHYSHNVFLDILCGQGVIGIIIFFWYIVYSLKRTNNKVYLLGFIISAFSPLLFVNGYNTMSFWIPMFFVPFLAKMDLKSYM